MKLSLTCLVVMTLFSASFAAAASAYQGIGTQEYVNRRINEMVINRAILKQATGGRKHTATKHSTKRTPPKHTTAKHHAK